MSALISDVIDGSLTPGICNAAVNAGGKLLKVVEMTHKYGKTDGLGSDKELVLCARQDSRSSKIEMIERQLQELKGESQA